MSTRGWEEGRGDGRKRAQPRHIWVHPVCFSFVPRERTRGGESEKSSPPPQVARSDNVDKNNGIHVDPPLGQGCNVGVAWRGVAGNVGVAWQGNVWFFFPLPSEIILFVHFNVESARFGSVRPTRFRHGEGGPRTRHARTFTSTSTSTSTPTPTPTSTRIHTLRPGPHPTPPCTYRIPRHSHRSKPSLPYLFGERERAPGPPPSLPPLPPGTASSLRPNVCC